MKILTIVGARPQFIKAAAVSRVIRDQYLGVIQEVIVHTGQHFDSNMSEVFFEELDIPQPAYNLKISGGLHGAMTGQMLGAIEEVLVKESPDCVLVYGDTNSTLAGALAAVKLHIPVAHVEAGLRSFNMRMPEEVNRILVDHISTMLFCPTGLAVENLSSEGVLKGVHNFGDVMFDVALFYSERARKQSTLLERLNLEPDAFILATCHRAENTDSLERLRGILSALSEVAKKKPLVFPLHPRTRKLADEYGLSHYLDGLIVTEPLPFLDMVALEQSAHTILTDSGGVQKEAFFYQVPCITMRGETEWVETVESGWNMLVDADPNKIMDAVSKIHRPIAQGMPYGDGTASRKILEAILRI